MLALARSAAREKAGRRVVEIIDGVLKFLKLVFLPLELARHVGDRPHRQAGLALAVTERAHAHPQPAPGLVLAGAPPPPPPLGAGLPRPPLAAAKRPRGAPVAPVHTAPRAPRAGG